MDINSEFYKQLIITFQAELDEGLMIMTTGLLELEKNTYDPDSRKKIIENIFRNAHNLKGASRGLGINTIGDIAHAIESIFSTFRNSDNLIPKSTIDICFMAIDNMKHALTAFINKTPLPFDYDNLIKQMNDVKTNPIVQEPQAESVQKTEQKSEQTTEQKTAIPVPAIQEGMHESIRVSLNTVDKISALAEEFQMNKISLDDQSALIYQLSHKLTEFQSNWTYLSELLKLLSHREEFSYIQKKLLNANDLLLDMAPLSEFISRENKLRVSEYARLNQMLQETVYTLRLVPSNLLLAHLPYVVREIANSLNKEITLEIKGGDIQIDKYVLSGLKDPINHLLRNAIDHGIESKEVRAKSGKPEAGKIIVEVKDVGNFVYFNISDDGAGINYNLVKNKICEISPELTKKIDSFSENELIDYLFNSGFSTKKQVTAISGRGVGLDVVKKNIASLKGRVSVNTTQNVGTTFSICVPLSLSSERGLIVRLENAFYTIPTSYVQNVRYIKKSEVINIEGNPSIMIEGKAILMKSLSSTLRLSNANIQYENIPIFILKANDYTFAFSVDEVVGEKEIVIKAINSPLSNIPCIEGGTLLDRNQIALVINPEQLIYMSLNSDMPFINVRQDKFNEDILPSSLSILVVDDSITTRMLEKNILESNNFHVTVAVNGQEAWELINKNNFSLIITDVIMPIMDGYELTEKIKTSDKFKNLPVIIVTSMGSDSEKTRGVQAGADAYIVKHEFESNLLLQKIKDLVTVP